MEKAITSADIKNIREHVGKALANIEESFVCMSGAPEEKQARLSSIDASLCHAVDHLDKIVEIINKG